VAQICDSEWMTFMYTTYRHTRLDGLVTGAVQCVVTFIVCLLLLALPQTAVAASAPNEPWQTLPQTPPLPPAVKTGYASVNGIRMFYAVFGRGSPVLLLHGGLANSNYWGSVIPILVRNHFEVVVADSRGHGRSTRTTEPYSYELMAADVLALLDYLKLERVNLVGWSDGGIIGLVIAMRHPERLSRLFAYGANSDPSGVRADVESNPIFTKYLQRTSREYRDLSPTPDNYEAFLAQIQAMWAQQPNFRAAQLMQITVPTTIADGAHDEAIKREHTEYLARTIPGATLNILPDVSHFGMLQNPQEFSAAVTNFLK
jgi:pimeloyl-ACP methyl ester carboxylesterase